MQTRGRRPAPRTWLQKAALWTERLEGAWAAAGWWELAIPEPRVWAVAAPWARGSEPAVSADAGPSASAPRLEEAVGGPTLGVAPQGSPLGSLCPRDSGLGCSWGCPQAAQKRNTIRVVTLPVGGSARASCLSSGQRSLMPSALPIGQAQHRAGSR